MKERVFAVVVATIFLLAVAMSVRAELEVEDVGPYKDAPGTMQREKLNLPKDLPAEPTTELPDADTDRDGIPDGKDECPDTPRLIGLFDIGETFSLEEVEFRYMGIRGERKVIHTLNVQDEEGGNQECVLSRGKARSSCIMGGAPEIQIILLGEQGTKVELLIRHRIDERGCSPEL
jgi:hypothetical protein